jgi:hypothetical protein
MVEAMPRRGRRSEASVAAGAVQYAAMGWPVCQGAYPPARSVRYPRATLSVRGRSRGTGRACSCDRIGCPAPGAHPTSPAWQLEASADPGEVRRWWHERPQATIILVTGRVFDVLDVPARAGSAGLARMEAAGVAPGPVAITGGDRALFFIVTRGAPAEEDEWWSCNLDCEPDSFAPVAGLRWHTRQSYVVAPPSRTGAGPAAHWIRDPAGHPLPDGLRLLEFLADACEEVVH